MLKRTITLFTLGLAAVLCGAAQSDAQPGKGFGKGPKGGGGGPDGAGADIQKLQKDLNRLMDTVKDMQMQLDRLVGSPGKKGEKGQAKGFDGKKGFEGKGPFGPMAKGSGGFGGGFGPMGMGRGGFGFMAEKGGKLDAAAIKDRYELYKGLYEESKRDGKRTKKMEGPREFNPGAAYRGGTTGSVEARIDRLIRELEQLRAEVKGRGRKIERD